MEVLPQPGGPYIRRLFCRLWPFREVGHQSKSSYSTNTMFSIRSDISESSSRSDRRRVASGLGLIIRLSTCMARSTARLDSLFSPTKPVDFVAVQEEAEEELSRSKFALTLICLGGPVPWPSRNVRP